ncbi:MAG: DUF4358 domain-containing protein [Oscillospiraceae bacterium]|nr:DUF4358 domain-containing protein [Oscillospiraceae bacterium]
MKKLFALLLAVAAVMSLAACGSKKTEEVKSADLNAFYEETVNGIIEKNGEDGFPMMMPLEGEMLDAFYPGLSEIATKQCVAYSPAMSAVAAEFVLVEVENAEDVEKAQAILQSRIDTQIDGGAWYPETIEGWKNNSQLAVNGNSLMLVVWEDSESIVESFNGLFA